MVQTEAEDKTDVATVTYVGNYEGGVQIINAEGDYETVLPGGSVTVGAGMAGALAEHSGDHWELAKPKPKPKRTGGTK